MQKILFLSLIAFSFLATACNAQKTTSEAAAATTTTTAETRQQPPPRQGQRPDGADVEAMTTRLGLDDAQVTKFKGIKERYATQSRELRKSAGSDREAMRTQMQELRARETKEINEILSTDQQTIYATLIEEQKAKRRQGGPGGGRPGSGGRPGGGQ